MAKIVLKGIDWLELNISFDHENSLRLLLKDIDKFNQIPYKKKITYLDKMWTKLPHKKNHKGRYELVSPDGIYLDFSSSKIVGDGYVLRISLLKPIDRSLPCLLWEAPFTTMNNILNQLKERYGKYISYTIARVDLFCHFSGINFKSSDSKRFLGLARGPWENDRAFTGFSFGPKRPKIKRIQASLYKIAERKIDLPNSFDPRDYYNKDIDVNTAWNLEFKVFRQFLKERGIDTLEELENSLSSIWKLLTTNKLRMIVKGKDSNKARWDTNPHWKSIQNAFGKTITILKRSKPSQQRQTPEKMIKRIETALIGLAASLDLWEKPLEERVKEVFGCFDISKFSNEEMIKYKYDRS